MDPEEDLAASAEPSTVAALPLIELHYASAALIGRDRLPQLTRGLLARTTVPVSKGAKVAVRIDAKLEGLTLRARAEVHWVTSLATSRLVGLSLEGESAEDGERLDHVLGVPAGATTADAATTPAQTPVLPMAAAPVLSVAMLQPNPVIREILRAALERLASQLGERWTLRLDVSARADGFLSSLVSRRRQLVIVDCDAVGGAVDALVDAIRSHEHYARLPIILLSGSRPARLEDRFAVTMQKPLTVKSFLHTTELLLLA